MPAIMLAPLTLSSVVDAESRRIGVMVDAGVPDGITASFVYRPFEHLRMHLGASHNTISPGLRFGSTLALFNTWITPTASLEAGSYSEGDANPLVQMVLGEAESIPTLERVGYRYINAHLGLEMSTARATFYLHAGFSRLWADAYNLQETIEQEEPHDPNEPHAKVVSPANITATGPSARLGLIVYY